MCVSRKIMMIERYFRNSKEDNQYNTSVLKLIKVYNDTKAQFEKGQYKDVKALYSTVLTENINRMEFGLNQNFDSTVIEVFNMDSFDLGNFFTSNIFIYSKLLVIFYKKLNRTYHKD